MPTAHEKPLTPQEREALGEYIIRQKDKGRTELTRQEIETAIEVIRATLACVDP